jgi:hypothetical protein
MKKFFTLFAMMVMLSFSSQAAYYLVGEAPFGNGWDPSNGLEMTNLNDEGLPYVKGTVTGTIYFVLADNLAAAGDWTTFNNEYRIGPTGGNEEVTVGAWISTQKAGGDNGAYKFTGTGSEYILTYNPYIKKFRIDGYVAPIVIDTYTVAGTPAAIFGTEWDPSNSDNDMTKQADGTYAITKYNCQLAADELQFKVVGNRDWGFAWPDQNYVVTVDEPGIYNVTITFNPETKEVNVSLEPAGSFDPRTGELYILGEVNGNGWDPSNGVKMDTEDGNIFTANITTAGENTDENDGIGYSFFSFTSMLAESSEDWSSIAGYRIGAIDDGYPLTDDMMGIELGLGSFGHPNSFKIPAGQYDLTVNLDAMTIVVNKAETPEPPVVGPKIEKVWEISDLASSMYLTGVRQGFGMGGKFYINDTQWNGEGEPTLYVYGENGVENTMPGGANTPITRDEAGNIIITTNVVFPATDWAAAGAGIKVINPETGEAKEFTIPEECGVAGRCDMFGFAKGNLMEDGVLYLTGGTNAGISVLTIEGGEVSEDNSYLATCEGISPTTSTVINYFKDLNGEDALLYVTRNAAPLVLAADGDNFTATAIALPGKAPSNGAFPFIWDGKQYFLYPYKTADEANYLDGFAVAEAGADEPLVSVPSTVAAAANGYQANWLNAEVDKDGVTIYQYYPGGHMTVYRLTNESGGIEELITDTNKVVAGVRYYNIMGQEMKEANGLTIVVTTYTDGSHSAVKIIK